MSENNESGNRWEKPAEPADDEQTSDAGTVPPVVEPVEPVAAQPSQEPVTLKLPNWVSKRGLVATGAIAAIFLGGGGAGYAIGSAAQDDDCRQVPVQFDRDGMGPGGQLPGGGQAPDFQHGPQSQSQDDSGSDSGTATS